MTARMLTVLSDDDGDGIIFTDIKGNGFVGYMITVLDPSRVFVGMPDSYGGVGLTLQELVNKYGAEGGINAGGFKDDGGGGFGGIPEGITVINGEIYNGGDGSLNGFAGFDKEGSSTSGTSCTMILLPPGSSTAYPLVLSSSPTVSLLPLSILRAASIQEQPSHSVPTARSSCSLSTDASCKHRRKVSGRYRYSYGLRRSQRLQHGRRFFYRHVLRGGST